MLLHGIAVQYSYFLLMFSHPTPTRYALFGVLWQCHTTIIIIIGLPVCLFGHQPRTWRNGYGLVQRVEDRGQKEQGKN